MRATATPRPVGKRSAISLWLKDTADLRLDRRNAGTLTVTPLAWLNLVGKNRCNPFYVMHLARRPVSFMRVRAESSSHGMRSGGPKAA